jgi:hypothetical protein
VTFEEFVARKDAARAERDRGRVTWRRVSRDTGGGYSGYGRGGALVYVRFEENANRNEVFTGEWEFGRILSGGFRVREGVRSTMTAAKAAAGALIR